MSEEKKQKSPVDTDGLEQIKSIEGAIEAILYAAGYPVKYESGFPMTLPEDDKDGFIYVAGAKRDGEKLLSAGGRVLGVTAVADTLDVAIQKAYERVSKVSFENGYYRSDIGARAMKALQK